MSDCLVLTCVGEAWVITYRRAPKKCMYVFGFREVVDSCGIVSKRLLVYFPTFSQTDGRALGEEKVLCSRTMSITEEAAGLTVRVCYRVQVERLRPEGGVTARVAVTERGDKYGVAAPKSSSPTSASASTTSMTFKSLLSLRRWFDLVTQVSNRGHTT